ncbi:hypothetical protein AVEN_71347-1 [Araneus ventricosus]|uniref:RNase H type-1 domain-containing protein n=1 Tax=Araneus ventricosus TaxID=182803 RepID=A0A4Y2BIY1_ARAVE|nr:hypothetical protein AVEN_71347-1 [Araneus ventricosus]
MGTYHCGSAAASKVAPSGRGNLHIDTWNAKDPLSQRHLKTKKILFAGDLQPPTSPRVPFTSFHDVQPPKKNQNHSVCPSPPTKRPAFLRHRQLRHFPLERSPKFRTRYFVTSQQNCVIHSYFHCRDFQQPNPPLIIHPGNFDLEDRISIVSDPHPPAEAIYTDSSHLECETDCAFCVIQNNVQIHQRTAKLSSHNAVFQAETLAIKEAINWTNSKGIPTSIWSDSESALRAISSFKSSNSLIQETQQTLLQNPSMQLNWIKAHIGFLGNEAADNLAKQATK